MSWSRYNRSKRDSYRSKMSRRQRRKAIIVLLVLILGIALVIGSILLAQWLLGFNAPSSSSFVTC